MRCMLHASPFTAIDELQIMEPLVQGITERTIEIAVEGVGRSLMGLHHSS